MGIADKKFYYLPKTYNKATVRRLGLNAWINGANRMFKNIKLYG